MHEDNVRLARFGYYSSVTKTHFSVRVVVYLAVRGADADR